MQYLDYEQLARLDTQAYQNESPFPWAGIDSLVTPEAYATLLATLPDRAAFAASFGMQRKNRQQAHDRYTLEYSEDAPVAQPWHDFITELRGNPYRDQLCRLLGVRHVALNFHWHYTPTDCLISPHTDSIRKAGSHIFYFNTELDWRPEWGGQTLLLAARQTLSAKSAPDFAAFDTAVASASIGNRSLLFSRTSRSWHGMRPLTCPEDAHRKVFIVVINHNRPRDRLRRWVTRKQVQVY